MESGKEFVNDPARSAATGTAPSAQPVPATSFTIVGLGASAGGLEAFEQFFRKVQPNSGMAFVLVPHLDPEHESILCEILQRCTAIPVVEVQDQMAVAPDHVYVIPPNRDLAIFHGLLQLSVPEMPRGQRMPIDAFLRSLAEDYGELAVGVILSGTGTDGTLGLRAILGAGGITMVQEPTTAKYDGMPASAIRAGYATHVLPAAAMPAALLAFAHGGTLAASTPARLTPGGVNRVLMLVRSATGHDFSLYKRNTIGRRIERRMTQHNLTDLETYCRYLREHPAEVRTLFKELLINVTSFFRDPEAFVALKQDVLPQLLAAVPLDDAIRVWVVGCATGEEAYSIAMLLREFMDETHREFKVQIYSTDLDDDAIAIARAGVYPPNVAVDLSAERLRRFFVKEDAGFRVKKEIREMVVFAVQNVIKDPPFTKLNLVSCRNLLIYLEPELQDQLIRLFHYSLLPGGVLFLSPSESIGTHPDLFQALNRKWKLYRTLPSAAATRALIIHERAPRAGGDGNDEGSGETLNKAKVTDFSELTRRALLQSYAPASVLVDTMGNILFVYGETGKYLRPAPGQASLNVVDMARDGLQPDLRLAVHAAATQGTILLRREVSVTMDGAAHTVRLSVRPLAGADRGNPPILVCFEDVASPPPAKKSRKLGSAGARDAQRIEELERELVHARDSLRATIEEAQTSHEDGKSANEELQSTNEELQSTNEELETSKEELQSVNEELTTVNAELQAKVEQLIDMQNDMKNLLDNVNVGTIFLNQQLLVRRFTREAQRVYRLVPTDVGRPLADIKSDLSDIDLMKQAQQVLDTLVPFEREVRTDGGASFLVRIQPYRTLDNVIDGVVLTYTDITQRVKAQAAVEAARNLAEGIVNTVREPLVVLDSELRVVTASRSFYQRFRAKPEETLGRALFELGDRQWDIKALRDLLQTIVRQDEPFENLTVEQEFPSIGRHQMLLNARRVIGDGNTILVLLAIEDVSGKA